MLVTLSGIVTLVSPLHPENEYDPMLVTLSGIVTLVSPLQSENAEDPMLVTGFPLSVDGIVTAPVEGDTPEISAVSPLMLYVHV